MSLLEFTERWRTLDGGQMKGLKDHEIQELVNVIRDEVEGYEETQALREVISGATIRYLESKNLRIDKGGK